MEERLLTFR